jgi:putative ABC transport system permease protein
MSNLKLALRSLFRTPFVTTVAVGSLALGIGANAAIFSLFDQLLLRPLPAPDPARLVNLAAPGPNPGSQSCSQAGNCEEVWSYPMFRDLEKSQTVFTGIAAHRNFGANLAPQGQTPINGSGLLVSGSYFPVLGLTPAAGRLLTPADDQVLGANFVAVLSYGYWATQLGSDRSVVGKQIVINGYPYTVVGVAPRGFTGTTLGTEPKVFVPLSMRAQTNPGFNGFDKRRTYWIYLFARLKPGVTMEQAAAGINRVYKPILTEVEAPLQEGMSEKTMVLFKAKTVRVVDGRRGQSSLSGETRTPLTLLFGLTGLVLVIACANIANLLLARGANRTMEMAVRLSLGAGRAQLLTQLLVESCILAVLGGAASLLVVRWTLGAISAFLPTDGGPVLEFGVQTSVLVFTAAVSIGTGLLFGMFPALHSTRPDLITTIRANSGPVIGTRSANRFRTSLVTAQIALSMALLTSAGLFIKSLMNVSRVDLGIETSHVLTFGIEPELSGYTPARSRVLFQRVEEELRGIPGVTAVAAGLVPLLVGDSWGSDVSVEGFKKDADTDANSRFNEVNAGYAHALGIPLLAGREFTPADGLSAPRVAIVNETFAKKFGLGRNPVGKHMNSNGSTKLEVEIVGLVKDAKYNGVKEEIPPLFMYPYAQDSTAGSLAFYVRTSLDPEQVERSVRGVLARIDPALPVEGMKTFPQQVKENVLIDRLISTLSAAFALLATVLAAVGLYGVLAYTVARRTKEIGVRMALGADGGRVRGMVLRQVGRMTLVGSVIGIGAALALGRAARSLLFGLGGADPVVIVGATGILAIVALSAGYLPARRASRVHPMQALRYE